MVYKALFPYGRKISDPSLNSFKIAPYEGDFIVWEKVLGWQKDFPAHEDSVQIQKKGDGVFLVKVPSLTEPGKVRTVLIRMKENLIVHWCPLHDTMSKNSTKWYPACRHITYAFLKIFTTFPEMVPGSVRGKPIDSYYVHDWLRSLMTSYVVYVSKVPTKYVKNPPDPPEKIPTPEEIIEGRVAAVEEDEEEEEQEEEQTENRVIVVDATGNAFEIVLPSEIDLDL